MSMDRCCRCNDPVDTDEDLDCYIEVGNMRRMTETVCVCEHCRDKEMDQREYEASMTP